MAQDPNSHLDPDTHWKKQLYPDTQKMNADLQPWKRKCLEKISLEIFIWKECHSKVPVVIRPAKKLKVDNPAQWYSIPVLILTSRRRLEELYLWYHRGVLLLLRLDRHNFGPEWLPLGTVAQALEFVHTFHRPIRLRVGRPEYIFISGQNSYGNFVVGVTDSGFFK